MPVGWGRNLERDFMTISCFERGGGGLMVWWGVDSEGLYNSHSGNMLITIPRYR